MKMVYDKKIFLPRILAAKDLVLEVSFDNSLTLKDLWVLKCHLPIHVRFSFGSISKEKKNILCYIFSLHNIFSKLSKRPHSLEKYSKTYMCYRYICRKKAKFECSQQSMGQTVHKSTKCGIYGQELAHKDFKSFLQLRDSLFCSS